MRTAASPSPVAPPTAPPPEALRICAEDLGLREAELVVVDPPFKPELYLNPIFFVARRGETQPDHVVKVSASQAYCARHEFEALEFAGKVMRDRAGERHRLGVIRPVGFGTDPSFLVTRFQHGELAQRAFDASLRGWRRRRPLETASAHARAIARWLDTFRSSCPDRGGGFESLQYLERARELAARVGSELGARRAMAELGTRFERYVDLLGDDDRARLARTYPNRGDARPKNFIAGSDGVLYALDMEAFGYGPLEHDLSCFHHFLEYQSLLSRAAARRASALWAAFWDGYMALGNSPSFAVLGYTHFLLERLQKSRSNVPRGWRKRLRGEIWVRNRLRWLGRLSGDLAADAREMRRRI